MLTGLACVLPKVNAESRQGLGDEKNVALGSIDLTEPSEFYPDVSTGACSQDRGAVTMVTEQSWSKDGGGSAKGHTTRNLPHRLPGTLGMQVPWKASHSQRQSHWGRASKPALF